MASLIYLSNILIKFIIYIQVISIRPEAKWSNYESVANILVIIIERLNSYL